MIRPRPCLKMMTDKEKFRFIMKSKVFQILTCIALSFIAVPGRVFAQAPAGAADGRALLGDWEGFVVEGDGSQQGQRRMSITLHIGPDKITSEGAQPQVVGEGTYRVAGGTGGLKHIDATGSTGHYQGKLYQGVFTIEGNTLKWCSGNPGKGRPSELKTSSGNGHFLMVLTRKA